MNSEISNQQNYFNQHSAWLAQIDNVNDIEAAQLNGGISLPADELGATSSPIDYSSTDELASRANELYYQVMDMNMDFQEATTGDKVAKNQSGKVSG